jgi:hypothetical protein
MSSCLAFLTVFLAMVPFPRTLKNSKAKQLRTQTMTLRALERAFLPSVSADRQSGQILHKIDEKSNARAEMKDCASVFLKRNYHIAFTTTKHHSIPRQQSKRHGGNTTLDAWIVGRIQEMHSPLHSEPLVLFLFNRTICAAICKTRTEDIVKHLRNFKTTQTYTNGCFRPAATEAKQVSILSSATVIPPSSVISIKFFHAK